MSSRATTLQKSVSPPLNSVGRNRQKREGTERRKLTVTNLSQSGKSIISTPYHLTPSCDRSIRTFVARLFSLLNCLIRIEATSRVSSFGSP